MLGGGRFVLQRELGRGGMGVVWLAQDTELREAVALKFLPPEIAGLPQAIHDLRNEAQKSRRLSHPNIVRIHDFHHLPGELPFISMEFVEGTTLAAHKAEQEQRCLPWAFIEPRLQQVCAALQHAHEEQLVHRDLKPGNLILNWRWQVKISDFGLSAAIVETLSRVTNSQAVSGTPCYMSPQQIEGRPPKPSDDLYSLGATLYELLSSQPPFYEGNIPDQVRRSRIMPLGEQQRKLGVVNPVPPAAAAAIMACLEKDPARRPPSAQALAEWLVLGHKPASASDPLVHPVKLPAVPISDEPNTTRPLVWLPAVLGTVLAILIGVVAAQWWHRRIDNISAPTPITTKVVPAPPPTLAEQLPVEVKSTALATADVAASKTTNTPIGSGTLPNSQPANKPSNPVSAFPLTATTLAYFDIAARSGDVGRLQTMLQGNPLLLETGYNGNRPLYTAARYGQVEAVRFLLDQKADPDARPPQGQTFQTALHIAASFKHTAVVALLLERGAQVNLRDARRKTPLSLAMFVRNYSDTEMQQRHEAVVALLRQHGATE